MSSKTTNIETVIDNLHEMQRIAKSLQEHEVLLNKMPNELASFGYTHKENEKAVYDKSMEIIALVKEYKKHTKAQFEALRAFEVQGAEPIDYTPKKHPLNTSQAYTADSEARERNPTLDRNF